MGEYKKHRRKSRDPGLDCMSVHVGPQQNAVIRKREDGNYEVSVVVPPTVIKDHFAQTVDVMRKNAGFSVAFMPDFPTTTRKTAEYRYAGQMVTLAKAATIRRQIKERITEVDAAIPNESLDNILAKFSCAKMAMAMHLGNPFSEVETEQVLRVIRKTEREVEKWQNEKEFVFIVHRLLEYHKQHDLKTAFFRKLADGLKRKEWDSVMAAVLRIVGEGISFIGKGAAVSATVNVSANAMTEEAVKDLRSRNVKERDAMREVVARYNRVLSTVPEGKQPELEGEFAIDESGEFRKKAN